MEIKCQESSFRSTCNKIQDWLHNVQFIFSCMLMCVFHVFFILIPNLSPKQLLVLTSIKFNNLKFLKVLKSHNVPRFYFSLIFSIVPRSSSCGTSKGSSKHTSKRKNVSIPMISTLQCKKIWMLQLASKENTKKPWKTCVSSLNEIKTGKTTFITNPKPSIIQNSSPLGLPFSKHKNGHNMVDICLFIQKVMPKLLKVVLSYGKLSNHGYSF